MRLLEHRRWLLYAVLAALAVALPTLTMGFFSDDSILVARIEGKLPGPRAVLDLYRFTSVTQEALREGSFPWWLGANLKLDFFRPLSSGLFYLDHRLFGHAPLGYHLHSLVWWAGLALAAGLVLRRALPGATGALALLVFVLDDAHVQPIGWISSRHVVVAAVPAMLGLAAHLRAREEGWAPGRALAVAGLALGLLASEAALGVLAYVFAYELVGRRDEPARTRWRAAAPVLALTGAYLAYYRANGHEAAGNDYYLEPFTSPARFAAAAAERVPILVADQFAGLPTELSHFTDVRPLIALGLLVGLGMALLYRALGASIPETERQSLRWLSLGAVGGLVAACGGYPGSRLLLVPGLGGAAIIAVVVRRGLLDAARPASRAVRAACWALAIVNVGLAPLAFEGNALTTAAIARGTERAAAAAEIEPPWPRAVYVVAASDPMASMYAGGVMAATGDPRASSWGILSMARRSHRLRRTGPRAFSLEVTEGTFFDGGFVGVFRDTRIAMHVGDSMRVGPGRVSVAATKDGAPTRIDFEAESPLDDPRLAFLAWKDGRLRSLRLPAIGESLELAWEPGPSGLF